MHLFDIGNDVLFLITRQINDKSALMNWILTCKHLNQIGEKAKVKEMIKCLSEYEYNKKKSFGSNSYSTSPQLLSLTRLGYIDLVKWWLNHCNKNQLEINFNHMYIEDAGNFHQIFDFSRINYDVMMMASLSGSTIILNWWKIFFENMNAGIYVSPIALGAASSINDTNILDWWESYCTKTEQKLKFMPEFLAFASQNNNTKVLNWWKDRLPHFSNKKDFLPNKKALEMASKYDKINILEWWKEEYIKNNIPFGSIYLSHAVYNGYLSVLKWWSCLCHNNLICPNNKPLFDFDGSALIKTSKNGHLHTLKWFVLYARENNFNIDPYIPEIIEGSAKHGKFDVLNWWDRYCKRIGIKFEYRNAINYALCNGCMDTLNWFYQRCKRENEEFEIPIRLKLIRFSAKYHWFLWYIATKKPNIVLICIIQFLVIIMLVIKILF